MGGVLVERYDHLLAVGREGVSVEGQAHVSLRFDWALLME